MKNNFNKKWYHFMYMSILYILFFYLLRPLAFWFQITIVDTPFFITSIIFAIMLILYLVYLSRKYPVPNKQLFKDKKFLILFLSFILLAAVLQGIKGYLL